ncbi:hypothetical protein GCM10009592_24430 [Brachybacterium rhamnosum]
MLAVRERVRLLREAGAEPRTTLLPPAAGRGRRRCPDLLTPPTPIGGAHRVSHPCARLSP